MDKTTLDGMDGMNHEQLKELAKSYGIPATGNRNQLLKRVHDHVSKFNLEPGIQSNPETQFEVKQEEPKVEVEPVISTKSKYIVTPKNGVAICLAEYGIPPEGMEIEGDDHPLHNFSYYLNVKQVA